MYNHEFCKEAHQHMHEIMEMWKNGQNMTTAAKLDYLVNRAICMDHSREDYWKDFHKEVYGANYPDVDYDEEKAKKDKKEMESVPISNHYHYNNNSPAMHANSSQEKTEPIMTSGVIKTEFTEKIKGKDHVKVMNCLAEFFDTLKVVDSVKYSGLMGMLEKID